MGAYIPPCGDVAGGVVIRVGDKATVCASERFAVPYSDMQTFGTSLGGVRRRYGNDIHTREFTLVFKETAELGERPRIDSPSERLVALLPIGSFADIGQVLNGYAFILAFGLFYNVSADSMVDNGYESPLTSTKPFQQPMCAACAFGLNGSPCPIILFPNAIDFGRRIGLTLGGDSNVGHAHVNAYKFLTVFNILVGNIYCLIEKKLTLDKKQVSLTLCILHQFGSVTYIRHLDATADNGDRSLLLCGVTKNTAVVGYCTELAELASLLLIKFVSVCNLADCPDYKLGGKTVSVLDGVVNLLVQVELTETTPLPCYCGNGIARLVEHADCLFKTLGLLNAWQQLYLQGQFHNAKVVKISESIKYLKEIINQRRNVAQFLPWLNPWVSLSRIS